MILNGLDDRGVKTPNCLAISAAATPYPRLSRHDIFALAQGTFPLRPHPQTRADLQLLPNGTSAINSSLSLGACRIAGDLLRKVG